MIRKTFAAVSAMLVLFSLLVVSVPADDKKRRVKRPVKAKMAKANPMVSMLPASDVIVTVNGKRFFADALPNVLSANQKLLSEILSKLDAIQIRTGVDLRKFENIVAGVNVAKKEGGKFDIDPVAIAGGTGDSASLIAAAKKSTEGKFREEQIGSRTMYVFSSKDITSKDITDNLKGQKAAGAANKAGVGLAVAAFDASTIVFGHAGRVRETIEAKSTVSPELIDLLGRKPVGVVNFAGKVPGGMSAFLPLGNDELGANIDSIKYLYGRMDVLATQATVSLTARTLQPQQAADLKGTLEGLRDLGKGLLGGSKGADKQLYARLLGNVKVTQVANEIYLDLAIPQTDLDALVAILK